MSDNAAVLIGFVLTLFVVSYLVGDNVLYRLAVYIFVGVTAGFTVMLTVEGVLLPWLRDMVFSANPNPAQLIFGLVPFFVGLLLLMKFSPRLSRVGNLGMAILIGIGTAVALVGAISGTLLPLVESTGKTVSGGGDNLINGAIIILGTITTLLYFQYIAVRRPSGEVVRPLPLQVASYVGQIFLIVTFASLYAGAILSSLTIFSERVAFFGAFLEQLLG